MSRGRAARATALVWYLALAGCPDKSGGFVLVKNACATNADCLEADAGPDAALALCNDASLQCERATLDAPYRLVLHVRPNQPELGLVEQYTYEAFTLEGSQSDHTLEVPLAVAAEGAVSWTHGGATDSLESEVTFLALPQDQGVPVSSTVVHTRGERNVQSTNLRASLVPETDYQVQVQPLLEESAMLPPLSFRIPAPLPIGDNDIPQIEVPPYQDMERRNALLLDEFGAPFVGHPVRLEDKLSGEILSSTGRTDMRGAFELYALPSVMAGQSFNVVVSLQSFPRWRVKVAIDGSKLIQNAPLVLPRVPDTVEVSGSILPRELIGKGPWGAHADIIFVSTFPVPEESGDARSADWCRWQRGSSDRNHPPLCSASIATTADAQGKYSVALLPGLYEAFVVPSTQSGGPSAPYRTTYTSSRVLSQADGTQGGQTLWLDPAARYEGKVVSFDGEPMPNVTVTARSLVPQERLPDREVYQYARSAVAVTDDRGRFFLNVDLGYFDLSVEPPAETGFPWIQQLNREVSEDAGALAPDAGKEPVQLAPLVGRAPVIVSGRVVYNGDMPLEAAVVEAFALVESVTGGRRAVRIAQAVSDAEGSYRLALPPEVLAEEPADAGAASSE